MFEDAPYFSRPMLRHSPVNNFKILAPCESIALETRFQD